MRSAVYEGVLTHARAAPGHRFRMRLAMPLLDLEEIDTVVAMHPLWSTERRNVASFRRRDFLGAADVPLDCAVRDRVHAVTGRRPTGPISLLGHVRTWGWLFNPLVVFFCYDPTGTRVEHAVLHVTNTPWKEEHTYVLGGPGRDVLGKALHVSPFFGMDQRYRITYDAPGESFTLKIVVEEAGTEVFRAVLQLVRRDASSRSLARVLWRYPMLTARVSLGIHSNALRLWRKGARFSPHPDKNQPEESRAGSLDRPDRAEPAA